MWQTLKTHLSRKGVQLGLVAISSAGCGATAGYVVATKKAELKYSQIAEQEIAEAKAYYESFREKPSLDTLKEKYGDEIKVEGTPEEEAQRAAEALQTLTNYQGETMAEQKQDQTEADEVAEEIRKVKTPTRNIFRAQVGKVRDFDWELELSKREASGGADPFIITKEEFDANENDWNQQALTFYGGDDTLADEADMPIMDIENTVGWDALTNFGYGSGNPGIVYVRNPRVEMDMEIAYSERDYSQEVGGLRHSSDTFSGARKFRGFDE
jgi:hypothetical protein